MIENTCGKVHSQLCSAGTAAAAENQGLDFFLTQDAKIAKKHICHYSLIVCFYMAFSAFDTAERRFYHSWHLARVSRYIFVRDSLFIVSHCITCITIPSYHPYIPVQTIPRHQNFGNLSMLYHISFLSCKPYDQLENDIFGPFQKSLNLYQKSKILYFEIMFGFALWFWVDKSFCHRGNDFF